MTDVASLGLAVDSSQIKEANLALKAMPNAASAAERAAQRWGVATDAAGNSAVEFSKRTQKVIRDLEFERDQLGRTAAEQARYSAVRRAGVSASSAQGQAIMASVAALQAQRAATESAAKSTGVMGAATSAASAGFGVLLRFAGPLAIGMLAVGQAMRVWEAGMKAADIGEQAEQVNLSTDALQAYRFAAVQAGVESQQLDQAMIRLTASMGAAFKGGEEQIKTFERLGVKLLDAQGQLRATQDVLPELARGLLGVSSATERNAIMTELFGKSGARMATMLETLAQGNDKVIASAKAGGGILGKEVIEQWDRTADAIKRAGAATDVTYAKLGAPIATAALVQVQALMFNIERAAKGISAAWKFVAGGDAFTLNGVSTEDLVKRQETLKATLEVIKGSTDALDQARAAGIRQDLTSISDTLASRANIVTMPAVTVTAPPLPGVSNPVPKGQADAYQKIIAGAQQYIAMKNIETQALGMNAEAAARLKHEQELLGKATEGGVTLGAAQTAQLKGLAAAMAEADAKFKSAKFMDDATDASRKFIAAQEVERATLFMSAEAAMAYRIEQELLTKAANDNITVTATMSAELRKLAEAQAAAAEKTRVAKEWADLGKDAFRGFFADINQGARAGKSALDILGDAMMNMLNKVSDKLMQMAADRLWEEAFPKGGGGGGGGGGLGGLFGSLFGGAGDGMASGGELAGLSGEAASNVAGGAAGLALGGVLNRGHLMPFARGGIVSSPTLFPMANGTGLMGEAGPEAIIPLRRGPGGRLGVSAHGNDNRPIIIHVSGDSEFIRVTARDEAVQVVRTAAPGIESRAVSRAKSQVVATMDDNHRERGGDYRAG